MEYTICEGKKIDSKHYLSIGYRYTLTQIYGGTKYLRCTLWRTQPWNCPGKAFICDDSNLLTNKQDHNHAPAVYNSETIKLRNKLKRAAENSTLNLREMFDDQTRDEEAGASIAYCQIRNSLVKRRKKLYPGVPSTSEEFKEMIFDSGFLNFYRGSVSLPNNEGTAILFISDLMLANLKLTKSIKFDATFYVVPKIFYQLFTIFTTTDDNSFPCVHVLMSRKTEGLYRAVLEKILEIEPDLKPDDAIGDFEVAPRNAFKAVIPSINIKGCLFHYCQAIWTHTKKYNLVTCYSKSEQFKKWLKCIMALPLLPQGEIGTVFKILSEEQVEVCETDQRSKRKLIKYINSEWASKDGLSIYSSGFTTNNACEIYHKGLKSKIRIKRPNIWSFMEHLEQTIKKYDLEYQRFSNGLNISNYQKSENAEKCKRREVCKSKLESTEYTSIQYLREISSTIGKPINITEEIDCGTSSSDDSEEEVIEASKCIVCLSERLITFILMPCAHANICAVCAGHFEIGMNCPACRTTISDKFRIYS